MILLQRKRMLLILGAVFLSVFSFLFGSNYMYKTVETVSLPVSGKTIILDARAWAEKTKGQNPKMVQQTQKPI